MTTRKGNPGSDSLRIDRWLFFCRFFKTRSKATAAVTGGHVRLNGERAAVVQPFNAEFCEI